MNAERDDHTRSAYTAWLAVCLLWGVTYLAIRIALETIPPALIGAIRYIVAGLLLAVILRARGGVGHQFGLGLGALQVACIGWALGSSYSRRLAREENAFGAATLQMIFGGLFMLAAATVHGEWTQMTLTWRSAAAELYLIVFGSLVGYTAYVYALKYLPVSTVSLYAFVNPVIAVVLGTLMLGEPFGLRAVVASAAVFVGVAVVRFKQPPAIVVNALRRRVA